MKSHKIAYKLIAPYYLYGGLGFIAMSIFLLQIHEMSEFHYAHPKIIATVHAITLGWTTMLIYGAGHQLIPVILNQELYSLRLLKLNLITSSTGIPLILAGLFKFNFGYSTLTGAALLTISAISFSLNVFMTAYKSRSRCIQSLYLKTATIWLIITCILGLLQAINFNHFILPFDSFRLLNTHAHIGLIGFISTTVIGVSSKLLHMFTLSKYQNDSTLKLIFISIHAGLLLYLLSEFGDSNYLVLSYISFVAAVVLFVRFTIRIFKNKMRQNIDLPIKSTLSFQVFTSITGLIGLIYVNNYTEDEKLSLIYGIFWLLGAIGSILIGMTFKTLPFMAWNEMSIRRPNLLPKDLYSNVQLCILIYLYQTSILLLCTGILFNWFVMCKAAIIALIICSGLYQYLIFNIHRHTYKSFT